VIRPPLQPLVPPLWPGPRLNADGLAGARFGPPGSAARTVGISLLSAAAALSWLFAGLMLLWGWASRNDPEGMAGFSALCMWAMAVAAGVFFLAYLSFVVLPRRSRVVVAIVGGVAFGLQPVAALLLWLIGNGAV